MAATGTSGWHRIAVCLTDEGRGVVGRIREQLDEMLQRVLSALTPEEGRQLMHLLQKVYVALSQPLPAEQVEPSSRLGEEHLELYDLTGEPAHKQAADRYVELSRAETD